MEKLNFVKNGVSKLPPGFRFLPTDDELVFQYLKCKIFKFRLPASIIPEINVCKFDPWDLPGNCEQERYFFSSKEAKYQNGNQMNRTTKSGYWKATGSDKKISSSEINNNIGIAGIKKSLVFYEGKSPNVHRTDWVMHEYRLHIVETITANYNSSLSYVKEIGDWILCRIFRKKRSIESNGNTSLILRNNNRVVNIVEVAYPRFFDFMRVHNKSSPTSSSSCSSSSSTMDVSSLEYEEISDYYYC